jgi:uncharacterized protein YunC (DUF1805 family)
MGSRLAALGAVLLGLVTVALVPAPAAALSCVATARATPDSLVRGTPLYDSPEGPKALFDAYDHVVVGRVTGIRPPDPTVPRWPAPAVQPLPAGGVSVDLDVLAVVNRPTTAAMVTVTMNDHGGMSGYRFEVGKHYFVVVNADNSYAMCGPTAPLSEVDPDPSRAVDVLRQAARASGVPFALPAAGATPLASVPTVAAPGGDGDAPQADGRGPAAVAAASAGIIAISSAGVVLVRRRRRTAGGNVPGWAGEAAT